MKCSSAQCLVVAQSLVGLVFCVTTTAVQSGTRDGKVTMMKDYMYTEHQERLPREAIETTPQFVTAPYSVNLNEVCPPTITIYETKGLSDNDNDEIPNPPVTYSMSYALPSPTSYILQEKIAPGTNQTSPQFITAPYSVNLIEVSPPTVTSIGTKGLSDSDNDEIPNPQISYSLSNALPSPAFSL